MILTTYRLLQVKTRVLFSHRANNLSCSFFEDCDLRLADFRRSTCRGTVFDGCQLTGIKIYDWVSTGAILKGRNIIQFSYPYISGSEGKEEKYTSISDFKIKQITPAEQLPCLLTSKDDVINSIVRSKKGEFSEGTDEVKTVQEQLGRKTPEELSREYRLVVDVPANKVFYRSHEIPVGRRDGLQPKSLNVLAVLCLNIGKRLTAKELMAELRKYGLGTTYFLSKKKQEVRIDLSQKKEIQSSIRKAFRVVDQIDKEEVKAFFDARRDKCYQIHMPEDKVIVILKKDDYPIFDPSTEDDT